jgi:hypothetical protein
MLFKAFHRNQLPNFFNVLGKVAIAIFFLIIFFSSHSLATSKQLVTTSPTSPSCTEVCAVVTTMPNAENTDELLSLIKTSRPEIIGDLNAMKRNMQQYDAEGYGWQSVIDNSNSLEPRLGAWLIGALRMACESSCSPTH